MAITPNDFSKIWASNADTPEYTFSEADYLKGWDFVGNLPPTRAQWNAMQKSTDEKMKYVFDNFGAPLTASTVAEMTMRNRVYVYTGSETGYTAGHWYYWNGSAWTDGGVYNAQALQTDTTLTVSDAAADSKVTGERIASVRNALKPYNAYNLLQDFATFTNETKNGITFTWNAEHTECNISGTASSAAIESLWFKDNGMPPGIVAGSTYYLYFPKWGDNVVIRIIFYTSDSEYTYSDFSADTEIKIPEDTVAMSIRFYIATGSVVNDIFAFALTNKKPESKQFSEIEGNLNNCNSVNILRGISKYKNETVFGVTYNWNADKTQCNVNGTVSGSNSSFNELLSKTEIDALPFKPGGKYYAEFKSTNTAHHLRVIFDLADGTQEYNDFRSGIVSFIVPQNTIKMGIRIHILGTGTVADGIITKCNIFNALTNETLSDIFSATNEPSVEMELFTEFEWSDGRWNSEGRPTGRGYHSNLLPIRPNTTYYIGYDSSERAIRVAFFNGIKSFISVVYEEDLTDVDYKKPDATGAFSDYVRIFSFTSPNDAKYLSLNTSNIPNVAYRTYVSSKPVFALTGTGNYIVHSGDPVYQKYKNRKLCMIGTSQLMTDRLERTGNFNEGENTTRYVVGIPEYLLPWWDVCDVYGYSSAPMMPTGGSIRSIYDRVVTDQLDLTAYDDFVITHSSSDITATNIGTLTNAEDLGDNTTFIGALRQIIAYVYSQNPKAKIWVQTRITRQHLSNPTRLAVIKEANQAIRDMAKMLSIPVIDCEKESGFNAYVAPYWCYDELGHYNHEGGKNMGLFFRKCILGF